MTIPLLVLLACGKGAVPDAAQPRPAVLVYTGNVDGEIEPCG